MAGVQAADHTGHLENICNITNSFFQAWNRRDVAAIAALFTEDAHVVNSLGLWWRGLTEVTKGLERMNAIGPALTPESVSSHLVTRDTGLCIVAYTVASFMRPDGTQVPKQNAISTFFMVNDGEQWRVAAAQTTAVNAAVIAQLQSQNRTG